MKTRQTPDPIKIHRALFLVKDGWSPEYVQEQTRLSFEEVVRVFQTVPERAEQWRV